jgi:oxygen-independent coproporphyrinogen-3 oxidase
LLRCEDYIRLKNIIKRIFGEPSKNIEQTLEGIPQLFNRDKVQAIKEAGFNRVSMGVQQMSDKLIRYSGRKQTHEQVISALEEFNAACLSVNVDLIYGWPEQTMQDLIQDLLEVCDLGVRHITLYQLNIAGRSDFSRQQRKYLPSFEDNYEMYQAACNYLRSRGFRQETLYDWGKIEVENEVFSHENAGGYYYEQQLREFINKTQMV